MTNVNIIEEFRKVNVKHCFSLSSFESTWPAWKNEIQSILNNEITTDTIIGLGNSLRDIFFSTNTGRNQSSQSSGGTGWECLVCWYLNLCLVESRTVVIFPIKKFRPKSISDAMSINYGNYKTNSESDLIAVTYPREIYENFNSFSFDNINQASEEYLNQLDICTLQCKTNWADNAQIPMLWDIVYKSEGFSRSSISVGSNGRVVSNFNNFNYAFITVPTQKKLSSFKVSSTSVNRVRNLSGGNYWGTDSVQGVAENLSEIFTRNFSNGTNGNSLRDDLELGLGKIENDYNYFDLN